MLNNLVYVFMYVCTLPCRPFPSTPPAPQPEERLMLLQPSQWNQLMRIDQDGSSLFQQLSLPFKTNPNVTIEPLIDQRSVRFRGVPEAVFSAHEHFADTLNKELHITDRSAIRQSQSCINSMMANDVIIYI